MTTTRFPLLLALLSLAASAAASAQTITVARPVIAIDPNDGRVVVRYHVTNNLPPNLPPAQNTMKDFHVAAPARVAGAAQDVGNAPAQQPGTWDGTTSGRAHHWRLATVGAVGGLTPGNSIDFVVKYPQGVTLDRVTDHLNRGRWTATNDANASNHVTNNNTIAQSGVVAGLVPTVAKLIPRDPVRIGQPAVVELSAMESGGQSYVIAAAFDTTPGLDLGGGLVLPLNPDPLFLYSLQPNPLLVGFQGTLQAPGTAGALLLPPADPALVGVQFHMAAVVLDPFVPLVTSSTDALRITIQP